MLRPEVIRPNFVSEYHSARIRDQTARNENIRASEEAVRALNFEIGQIVSSSFQPELGDTYCKRYKAIREHFQTIYDEISKRSETWIDQSDMTIPEFMLVDNLKDMQELIGMPNFTDMYYTEFIRAKARMDLSYWKNWDDPFVPSWDRKPVSIGWLSQKVEAEISLLRYAKARCEKHFKLRIWNLKAQGQIGRYQETYAEEIRSAFGRMNPK